MLTYTMTPAQSDTFILGGAAAAQVAQEITDHVVTLTTEDVLVLVDDGSVAFTLERGGAVMAVPTARQTFRAAVAQVAAKAKARLPQAVNGRIEKAVTLVVHGDVEPQEDGSIVVFSATDATRRYVLIGTGCTCADFERGQAPGGWCAHRIAAGIHKRVQELLPPESAPDGLPSGETTPEVIVAGNNNQPLYEAPASANVHVQIAGRDVLVTLRDRDEGRLLERLAVVLKQYPALQAPSAPAPTQGQGEGWCAVHQTTMKLTTKDGRSWYSHRTDAGWCKGKGKP
jgi:hypothetical protein